MKDTLVILLTLLVISVNSVFAGTINFQEVYQNTQNNELFYRIWASNSDNIYAGGSAGLVHYNGTSWSRVTTPNSENLTMLGVHGTTPNDIYAYGINFIDVSHNGGSTWATSSGDGIPIVVSMWSSSPTDIYAVAWNANSIYHSSGSAWESMGLIAPTLMNDIWGYDEQNIFAVGGAWSLDGHTKNTIARYDGNEWELMNTNTNVHNLSAVSGTSTTNVYVVGSTGTIMHFDGDD